MILRLKQAEVAMAAGRLDEAYELLSNGAAARHRVGQELIGRLAGLLVGRGREHLAGERVAQALSDCEKAQKLAGSVTAVAELRVAVGERVVSQQRRQQQRQQVVAAAREQIERGRWTVAGQLLEGLPAGDEQGQTVLTDLNARRVLVEGILGRAQAAMGRGEWERAADELTQAGAVRNDARLRELGARLTGEALQKLQGSIDAGRLDLADAMLRRVERLGDGGVEVENVRRGLEQCRAAWACVERGRVGEAEPLLRRLAQQWPGAKWISQTREQVGQAAEAVRELRAGPLAAWIGAGEMDDVAATAAAAAPAEPAARRGVLRGAGGPLDRFMLRVDGVGSFAVLRGGRVTFGPVSASPAPDVGLLAEPGLPVATIEREDEDYFLRSERPVLVNEQPVTRRLLAHGDRIALSRRCRIRFSKPSAASTSAVVHLDSARLPCGDVRHVILMGRELIIGAGPGAHVRADEMTGNAVLHLRDGRLVCTAPEAVGVLVGGIPAGRSAAIAAGGQVAIGPVSFAVTSW